MEKNLEQNHIENVIEPTESPVSEEGEKSVPLVLKQAHENNVRIKLGWRSWLIMGLCCFALAGQLFVFAAVGNSIAFIVRELGEPEVAGWIIQGPLLIQSVLSPSVGRLSDILDRKWMATVPPLIAFAGAVLSAKAPNMSTLIGGGMLIGVALPSASVLHAIQAEIMPLKYRAVANGLSFAGVSAGTIAAALGAGALTAQSFDGWRNIYWILAGFYGISTLGFLTLYWPEAHPDYPDMSWKKIAWEIDPIGSLLFMSGCALTLIALNWAGGTYTWSNPHVMAPLTTGLVLLLSFGIYEWKGRSDGLVAHVFFESGPNFPIGILGFTVEGWIYYSAVNTVAPQQILNLGFETDAWRISVRQLAYAFPTLATSATVTAWATKKKDLTRPLICTFLLFVAGTACWATLNPNQKNIQILYTVIIAIGQAGPLTLIVPLIQFTAPHAFLSTASGLAYSGRAIGGAFGSAVLNVIINNHLNSHLAPQITSAATSAGLKASYVPQLLTALDSGSPNLMDAVPGINQTILAAAVHERRWVYAKAYNLAWWSIFPFAVLITIAMCFLKGVKELMTEKVEATVENVKKKEKP